MKFGDQDALFRKMEKISRRLARKSETSVRNFASVPPKATIRLEYVRCGKRKCSKCFQVSRSDYGKPYFYHGPYFCAYWRDENNQGKLKKKYIGEWNPLTLELRLNTNGKHVGRWDPRLKLRKNCAGLIRDKPHLCKN